MNQRWRLGLPLLLLWVLSGCAALPPQRTTVTFSEQGGVDEQHEQSGLQVFTVPEGQRVMLIKSPDDVERVCAPRESDQGTSVSEGLSLSLPGSGGASTGGSASDQAVPLGSPSAAAQLARELLFRACELSLNLDADAAETREIYERFLATLEALGPALAPAATDGGGDDGDD